MIYYRGCFISYWFWKALENMVVRSLTVFLFFFCKTFFVILFFQNIIVKGGYHLPKKKGKEKKETVSSDITQWIYPWELGRLHRRKKKAAYHLWGRDVVFVTETPIIQNANQWERGRERWNCTVSPSLSFCDSMAHAPWPTQLPGRFLLWTISYHWILNALKPLCISSRKVVWFPNLKTALQGSIYTNSVGKRQGLTIQTELGSSFTCWKMRCQWTYAVVFIHSN